MTFRTFSAALATLCLLSATAYAQTGGAKWADNLLVDANGRTVYTFDKDTANSGKSVCNGDCAVKWPPVAAQGEVKEPYSVVTRDDGSKQLAFKGQPLYLWVADQKPGDRNGDKVGGVWHIVTR